MKELKELASRIVDLAQREGANDVIAEVVDSRIQQVRFSNNEIDAVNSWNEKHAIVLVAIGKHMLTSDLRDMEHIDGLVKGLVQSVKKVPPNSSYRGVASGRFKYRRVTIDRKIVSVENAAELANDAIHGAVSEGANNVGGTLFVRHGLTGIASSGGALASDEGASMDLSVRAFYQPEASGHAVSCTTRLSKLKPGQTGERAGKLAMSARNPVQGEAGKFDMVFEPLFLGGLIHSTSNMMSALRVDIGTSIYAKKLGKRVASEQVTFVDDPTMASTSARSFDHEGVPCRRNVTIKNGVLKMFFHNTSTAKKFKTRTTANAGPLVPDPFLIATQPVPFHPVVESGDWSVDEIIADTKRGLYLNNTWYTRYQSYVTGEFSTIPRDAILKIENGEIVGAAKNVRISDNMMNLWKSIDALSKTSEEIYWWDEAAPPSTLPTCRVRSMNISRSS